MASILKVDTITGVATAGSIAITGEGNSTTTNLQQGLAKAWMFFDTNTGAVVNDSLNISSITDVDLLQSLRKIYVATLYVQNTKLSQ